MAIIGGTVLSYREEILKGIHQAGDVYKLALYTSSATLNLDTTVYTTSGEITSPGYTAGGATLAGFNVTTDKVTHPATPVTILDFDNLLFTDCTIAARAALIYNSSRGNKAVHVFDFGADKGLLSNGTFLVEMPVANADTGLIRLS